MDTTIPHQDPTYTLDADDIRKRNAAACQLDVIPAAQALAVGATVVTDNVGHLALFVEAKRWRDIAVAEESI